MAKPRLTIVLGVRVNPRLAEALKRLEKARQLDKSDLIREAPGAIPVPTRGTR